jgi:hypothetical protein
MIDGIYNLEIKFGGEHVEGVAMVKGNSIKGLDSDRIYVVEFSGQHGESCWRFNASRYTGRRVDRRSSEARNRDGLGLRRRWWSLEQNRFQSVVKSVCTTP